MSLCVYDILVLFWFVTDEQKKIFNRLSVIFFSTNHNLWIDDELEEIMS